MAARFFQEHKKKCIITGAIIAGILVIVYLYAMFMPGVWHRDAFLYRQKDGSFAGKDTYAEYEMEIVPTDEGAEISFSVDEREMQYRVIGRKGRQDIQIYKNDAMVFKGSPVSMGDHYELLDEEGYLKDALQITFNNEMPAETELFPNCTQLYNWAVMDDHDTRGNPGMLIYTVIFAGLLALDIAFPRLFFTLDHGFAVKGGEPSDWYLACQKAGRVIFAVAAVISAISGFAVH